MTGENKSMDLPSGGTVHMIRPPGGKWHFKSYDVSAVEDPGMLNTRTANHAVWSEIEFESPEEVCDFIQRKIQEGHLPYLSQE